MRFKTKGILAITAALLCGAGAVGIWIHLSPGTEVAQAAHGSFDVPHVLVRAGNSNNNDPWLPAECARAEDSGWREGIASTSGHTDCGAIWNTNYKSSYGDDFRLCLEIKPGRVSCTPWASEGGGFGPTVESGTGEFTYIRATIEARANPTPTKTFNNTRLGIHVKYGDSSGGCRAETGMQYSALGNPTEWSYGLNKDDDPGCIQAGMTVDVNDPPVYNAAVSSASATVNPNTTYSVALDGTNLGNHSGAAWYSDKEIPGTKVGDCSNFQPDFGATCTESVVVASSSFKLELINPGATPITLNDTDGDGNPNRMEYRRRITTTYTSTYIEGEPCLGGGGGGIIINQNKTWYSRVIGMFIPTAYALPEIEPIGPGEDPCFPTEGFWVTDIQESPSRAVQPNETEPFGISYNTNAAVPGNTYTLNFRMVKSDGSGGIGVDINNRFGGTGSLTLTLNPPVIPPNFQLLCSSITPQSHTVTLSGSNQTFTYTIPSRSEGNYTGTVTLSISGNPSGTSVNNGSIVHPPVDSQGNVQVVVTPSATVGSASMVVNATAPGIVFDPARHSCPIGMVINPAPNFQLVCSGVTPQSHTVTLSGSNQTMNYIVPSQSQNGYTGTVTLTLVGSPAAWNADPIPHPPVNSAGNVRVIVTPTTTPGTYNMTINATAPGITFNPSLHSCPVSLVINPVVVTPTPTPTPTPTGPTPTPTPTPTAPLNPRYTALCAPLTHTMKAGSSHTITITTTSIDGYNSPVTWSHSITPLAINPPSISYTNNGAVPSAVTLANITTTPTTTVNTYNIRFTGTGGEFCDVQLIVQPPDPPNGPTAVTAANSGICETVTITWRRNPGGLDPTHFRVFRGTNTNGPFNTQIGGDVPYSGNATTTYSRTDSPPENADGTFSAYYYVVIAYRGTSASNPSPSTPVPGVVPVKCEVRIDTSDKDMTRVNGSLGIGPTQDPCNGNPETQPNEGDQFIPSANALLKPGDIGTFRICFRNSGNVPFTNITVVDNLENLENPSNYSYTPANCAAFVSTTGSTINFTASDLAAGATCNITFTASVKAPATSGTIERFRNRANISGFDSYNSTTVGAEVHTRPYNFSTLGGIPSRNETAP